MAQFAWNGTKASVPIHARLEKITFAQAAVDCRTVNSDASNTREGNDKQPTIALRAVTPLRPNVLQLYLKTKTTTIESDYL